MSGLPLNDGCGTGPRGRAANSRVCLTARWGSRDAARRAETPRWGRGPPRSSNAARSPRSLSRGQRGDRTSQSPVACERALMLRCECGDPECAEQLELDVYEYELVRRLPGCFVVCAGHAHRTKPRSRRRTATSSSASSTLLRRGLRRLIPNAAERPKRPVRNGLDQRPRNRRLAAPGLAASARAGEPRRNRASEGCAGRAVRDRPDRAFVLLRAAARGRRISTTPNRSCGRSAGPPLRGMRLRCELSKRL